jgi:hypothetical protein
LISHTEEDKGNCPLSNQFLIPAVAASVIPPVAVVLAFREGRVLMGALHFNEAFIISFYTAYYPSYYTAAWGNISFKTWLSLQ